jgi:hypothetical protein
MADNRDILSENEISQGGMSLLEVIAAYPEQALALLRTSAIRTEKETIKEAIKLIWGYREKAINNSHIDPVLKLIEYLEEKMQAIEEPKPAALEDSAIESQTDYGKAKINVSRLPKVYLGQEINTPLGKGIVINMSMPSNGLYLSPEKAELTVWFSTMQFKHGWVQYTYSYNDLKGYL